MRVATTARWTCGCLLLLGLLTPAPVAAQAKKVVGWALDPNIIRGDLDFPEEGNPESAITKGLYVIRDSKANEEGGYLVFRVRCFHEKSENNGPHFPEYRLEWKFSKRLLFLRKGETFSVRAKLTRTDELGSTCPPGNFSPRAGVSPQYHRQRIEPLKLPFPGVEVFAKNGGEPYIWDYEANLYAFPDNQGNDALKRRHELEFPFVARDVDSLWDTLCISGGGTYNASFGALYLFKAVYEGDPLPPGADQPSSGAVTGTGTGGTSTTTGGTGASTGTSGTGTGGATTGLGTGGPGTGGGPTTGDGFSTPSEPQSGVTQLTLQAGKRKARTGETVNVPVWLLNGRNVVDMNFNLTYDAAIVRAGGVVKGNLLGGADFEANSNQAGVVQFGFVPPQGGIQASSGTVANISFTVTGAAGSRTTLGIVPRKATLAGGAPANPAVIVGEILVVGPDGEVPGDANGDGSLNMDDVLMALKMSVGLIPVNLRADMDKDGKVTAADARLIRERVLGLIRR